MPLPELVAVVACSSHGSSTPSAVFCARGSPAESEGEAAAVDTTSHSPQRQPIREEDDEFTRSMADLVKDHWLKKLIATAPEKIETFVAESGVFFEIIKSFGGDLSSFRATVDSYVSCVKAFSAARASGVTEEGPVDRAIVEVERNLKSVQITLQDVRLAVKSQEQRLSSIAEERAKLKASLQALDEEEMRVVCCHSQQLEEISSLEPKDHALEQQQADLKVSKPKIERLKRLQQELEMMKATLGANT